MEPTFTRKQVERLSVPVLETMTLHLPGQPLPAVWLETTARPDVAQLLRAQHWHGPLTFTTQWVATAPPTPGAGCWLVVEVERPPVCFTLAFSLPASFVCLAEIVTSRRLALLCGACPAWLREAGRCAEEVEVERLHPVLAESLTLALDAGGCDRLAQYLLGWAARTTEGEDRWRVN